MKVREYEQLTKEQKIQLLKDQEEELMKKPKHDIGEFNTLYLIRDDIRRLREKRSCNECRRHDCNDNFCSHYGRKIVDFVPTVDSNECEEFKQI